MSIYRLINKELDNKYVSKLHEFGLYNWEIIQIDDFELDTVINYDFEILAIRGVIKSEDDWKVFARELARTNFKDDLKEIWVFRKFLSKARKIFEDFNWKIQDSIFE